MKTSSSLSLCLILIQLVSLTLAGDQTSTDGTCGWRNGNKWMCPAGQCCNQWGSCGLTLRDCKEQCQWQFGSCQPPPLPPLIPYHGPLGKPIVFQCNKPGVIAMTFDDGPLPSTVGFLDIFKQENIKVTFFVVGKNIKPNAWILQRAAREGHQIAAHSWSHVDFNLLNNDEVHYEMQVTQQAIQKAIGKRPKYMRFPNGDYNEANYRMVQSLGYTPVQFTFDSKDWGTHDPPSIIANYNAYISGLGDVSKMPGPVSLNHDSYGQSLPAWQTVIRNLKAKGFQFATVAECMYDTPYY